MGFLATGGILNRKGFFGGAQEGLPFNPSDIPNLNLWLSADYGVTTAVVSYVSQIVISGCTPSSSNGTYTRTSGGNTSLTGEGDNYIGFEDGVWNLYDANEGVTFGNYDYGLNAGSWEVFGGISFGTAVNTTTSFDGVTLWEDQSGQGLDAVEGDAPALNLNGINSKPTIEFSGKNWLQIPANNIGNDGNISIFIVIDYTSGPIILNKGDGATFEATQWEITTANGGGFVKNDDGTYSWVVVPFSISGLYLISMVTTNDDTELFLNNVSQGTSGSASPINPLTQNIGIGAGGESGNTYGSFDAKIPEILIYNSALSSSDRQMVQNYLNQKYAVY